MSHSVPSVCGFWREAGPDRWFAKDEAFDAAFRARFQDAHFAAARRELDAWADGAEGALALMILLDQFPRNAFRGTAHMYATDPLARYFADRAIDRGLDQQLEPEVRVFLYLPFSHSEALADQERAVALNTALGGDDLDWAIDASRHHRPLRPFSAPQCRCSGARPRRRSRPSSTAAAFPANSPSGRGAYHDHA